MALGSKRQWKTRQKHKVSHFYFCFRQKWNLWRILFFFQAEDGIRDPLWSRGLGDVYKRQEFQVLSKFSLVFINTTASSSTVVNHASTVNVFSCKNLQFELPQNFISQIDRGSVALSLEYHFSNESHVPRRDFRRWKMAKLMVAIILI